MSVHPAVRTIATITSAQSDALDTLGQAIYAVNSVDEWASSRNGTPYWHAVEALMQALRNLLGDQHAERIRDLHIYCGESITHCMKRYFDELHLTDPE